MPWNLASIASRGCQAVAHARGAAATVGRKPRGIHPSTRGRVCALVILLVVCASRLGAQSVEQRTSTLAHTLMSPFCPGLLLADCRSDGARALRAEIAARLAAGETSEAIENDLVARFGPQLRTMPGFHGVGAVAWIAPPLIGIAGIVLVVAALRSATRRSATAAAGIESQTEDPAMAERLRDELDAFD